MHEVIDGVGQNDGRDEREPSRRDGLGVLRKL